MDCFAMSQTSGKCRILNNTECIGCAFYKTKKDLETQREKCRNRIKTLPMQTRAYIEDKYNVSRMPNIIK